MLKGQFAALVRPQLRFDTSELSDDDIVESVFEALTTRVSGSDHIRTFLRGHKIQPGYFATWRQKKITEQQAKALQAALQVASTLHEMDNLLDAQVNNVPREILGQVKLTKLQTDENMRFETHRTDQQIRAEAAKAEIAVTMRMRNAENALEAAKRKNLQPQVVLEEKKNALFRAYDELSQIHKSNDPMKDRKLAIKEHEIKLLEDDFYGRRRAGERPVSESDGGEVGNVDADVADSRQRD